MKKKILEFKTVSPLFEMERGGNKYFTEQLIGYKDSRFRALAHWQPTYDWLIRITNPNTGRSFVRHIINVSRLRVFDQRLRDQPLLINRLRQYNNWLIIEWDFREVHEE